MTVDMEAVILEVLGKLAPGKSASSEEVARAALFLASDEASFVNGAQLMVDNGFTSV